MRLKLVLAGLAAMAAVAVWVGSRNQSIVAQPASKQAVAPAKSPAPRLPIAQVVLFSSGVGYFQREGEVAGSSRVELAFPATDINDLLKSLVLQDLDGGKISTINYDSPDPIEKTLKSFALDLTYNPTFGQILNQARGEKVEVIMQPSKAKQPGTLTGTIVGMEEGSESEKVEGMNLLGSRTEMLNLLGADGMRSLPLSQVQRVRFLNPVLDGEFKRALELLAGAHDTQKKTVALSFTGGGKRRVRVGYVVEHPIWKTSYRLVLNEQGKPLLQGWAVIENSTTEDWNQVRMVLVSGRPISFQMNLYEPLYMPRPTVEPDRFASLRPPAYSGAMPDDENLQAQRANMPAGMGGMGGLPVGTNNLGFGGGNQGLGGIQGGGASINRYQLGQLGGQLGLQGGNLGIQGGLGQAPRLTYEELQKRRQERHQAASEAKKVGSNLAAMDPGQGIASAASAEEIGDSFRYVIDEKVTLPRQKSAMLPIVNKGVEAAKVSIYNEGVQAKFPLLGIRFKNTSGLYLTQGPVTVYEGGAYAGDGRILDLQPNEERLLSYAIDLGTEVKRTTVTSPEQSFVAVKPAKDTLHVNYKVRQTSTYLVKNRSEHERHLIIEHPIRPDWKLVVPERPAQRTRDVCRFELPVPAGKTGKLEVIEEQGRSDQFALAFFGDQPLHYALPHLGAEVQLVGKRQPDELLSTRIVKGTLHADYRVRESRVYLLRNLTSRDRSFDVDHLQRPGWTLVRPLNPKDVKEPAVRLRLPVAGGKTAQQEVVEEQSRLEKISLGSAGEELVRSFLGSPVPNARVKEALKRGLDLRARLTNVQKELAELEKHLKTITDDQARLRSNLEKVPPTSAAHRRYLEKFDKQETEIERLQSQIKERQEAEKAQQKQYDDYLAALTVE